MGQGPWDSYKTLMELRRRMNQLMQEGIHFSELMQDVDTEPHSWAPPFDVIETEDAIVIYAEVSGINKDDISVQIQGSDLIVRGERHPEVGEGVTYHLAERYYGQFQRRFHLPDQIDETAIDTLLANGMLEIRIPKKKARVIPIQ